MSNLRDIRRRIASIEKTQQITRAMRMVAAAKLRRAQDAIIAARPYAERMRSTLAEVASNQQDVEHPLLEIRDPVRRAEVVVITSDRGLCGAFNANVLKRADALFASRRDQLDGFSITTVGRKATDYLRRRHAASIGHSYTHEAWVTFGEAVEIAGRLAERYASGETDEVLLIYNEFVSALTQRPTEVRLLPFTTSVDEDAEPLPYEIEPSPEQLLAALVPRALEVEVYRALLENQAGEHAARMTAMENATRNTEELIESLTLQFNRARQAAITKELVEIVTGAEAL